jgi:hypothetical protein
MKSCLALLVILAACGDNLARTTDAPQGIDAPVPSDTTPAIPRAVAVAGDFTAPPGVISSLDLSTMAMHENVAAGLVTDDPLIHKIDNNLYIINRDTNNVTVVDAATFALVTQIGTGANSNPQDVAVVGQKVYVPSLGTAGVVVGHLDSTATSTIDLNAATGETDGKPNCDAAFAVGTDVYVACGILDNTDMNLPPKTNGVLVVIDTTTDTVRTHITMPVKNPEGFFRKHGSDLLIATYDAANGCTIKITPGTTPTATCLVMNNELGGTANSIDVAGDKLWFAYSNATFTNSWARSYDLTTSMFAANMTPDAQSIHDVAVCPDGKIAVTEGAFGDAGGIRIYNNGTEVTTGAISIGIAPVFSNGLVCY